MAAVPVAAPAAAPPAAGSSKTLISANEDLREVFAQASRVCACIAGVCVSGLTRRLEGGGGQWRVEAVLVLSLRNETNCNAKARRKRQKWAGFGGGGVDLQEPTCASRRIFHMLTLNQHDWTEREEDSPR